MSIRSYENILQHCGFPRWSYVFFLPTSLSTHIRWYILKVLEHSNNLQLWTKALICSFAELSAMIRGIPEKDATVVDYQEEDAEKVFTKFFNTN